MLKYLLVIFCLIFSSVCQAKEMLSLEDFAGLPILHEGRIKPLDSFARLELLKFSKKESLTDKAAILWLADAIFDPSQSVNEKIFMIEDASSRHILGLEERQKPLYSYIELISGLEKTSLQLNQLLSIPPKELSASQKALLDIHENAIQYTHILRSFSSVLPLNIQLDKHWRIKADLKNDEPVTFAALQKISPAIEDKVKSIIKKKGEDPATYNPEEQALVTLGWQLKTIADAGQKNNLLRVIPTLDGDFASPWELINDGKGTPSTAIHLQRWIDMASAWQSQNQAKWDEAIAAEIQTISENSQGRLQIERIYNQFSPFTVSIFLFAASLCAAMIFLGGNHLYAYRAALALLLAAIIVQVAGIALRIYLMERPPVGTLYESILFVALVAPLVGLMVERRLKNGSGILSGAISGAMLGILAVSLAGEGDNLKVLGAVLNTRFWLTTHVLCITIGYGWCLLTSLLAHIILTMQAFGRDSKTQNDLVKTMTTHSLFSLLFTTVGTILGGIWADQSWGRFWGWDPKENGALLIVLWLVWLIHGKIAGQISQMIWVAGMALLSVVVAVAWVGVNLLGVGLHSYGFIEGVFWGLGGFAAFELILVCFLCTKILRTGRGVNAH